MTAITKAFTAIADAAVDPDSPVTTSLVTALRDNSTHLREWLGAAYTAGAVQDHDHDGLNSALIDVGPNLVRNGSVESGAAGWTRTAYSGGTLTTASGSTNRHGLKALQVTSTVLANGGGEAIMSSFIPVGEGDTILFRGWAWASVANISVKVQAVWYDYAYAQISATDLVSLTNTPTAATLYRDAVAVPATAKFLRLKQIGGVPATGTATGTVYFDGWAANDWPIAQEFILAGAVGRAQLKTTTGSGSVAVTTTASYSLAGGSYAWWTAGSDGNVGYTTGFGDGNTAAGTIGLRNSEGFTRTWYVDERYVQASPPYDLGNGDVPLFVWALVDGAGNIQGTQIAPDPTWAYHGPTNISPESWRGGVPVRRYPMVDGEPLARALKDPARVAAILSGEATVEYVEQEITPAWKNIDMPVVPHPFLGIDRGGCTVVLVDPVGLITERLALIHGDQGAREVRDLLLGGYLRLDNVPLDAKGPPGVMCARAYFTRHGEIRRP